MLFFILFLILLGGRLGCLRFLFLCLCCYELLLLHPVDFVWLCFHCQFPQDILKFCDFIDLLDLSSMFFQSPCIFFLFFFLVDFCFHAVVVRNDAGSNLYTLKFVQASFVP